MIYWIYHTLLNCLLQQTFDHYCHDLFVFLALSLKFNICELVCQSKLNSLGSISIRSDSRLYWISGVRTRYWWPWWCKWMTKIPSTFLWKFIVWWENIIEILIHLFPMLVLHAQWRPLINMSDLTCRQSRGGISIEIFSPHLWNTTSYPLFLPMKLSKRVAAMCFDKKRCCNVFWQMQTKQNWGQEIQKLSLQWLLRLPRGIHLKFYEEIKKF